MVKLWGRIAWQGAACAFDSLIARLDGSYVAPSVQDRIALVLNQAQAQSLLACRFLSSYKAILSSKAVASQLATVIGVAVGSLEDDMLHVEHQDVVKVSRDGRISVLYKNGFQHNSILVTDRCNNYCTMCSQPPREENDDWILDEIPKILELIPKSATAIGLTGGEPTLAGDRLVGIIRLAKNVLPNTALHILSNGRKLAKADFAKMIGAVEHHDLMFGIPIYSDNYLDHDFVVQASNAFSEAISGIVNLKRFGVKVEIRCVLHRDTIDRLGALAEFISRNLTFVDHVALMGYEAMGFGRTNAKHLFVHPDQFMRQLELALNIFSRARIRASVYNLPFCLLSESARRHSVQSISEWKNEYLEECNGCIAKPHCTGFFTSSMPLYAGTLRPQFVETLSA